ncbi:MAG: BrnA antitoxin family protein [Moraxellaceae bacterium]|nr:BrnA antitoxin family protein [Moraxellaceae bacterium]
MTKTINSNINNDFDDYPEFTQADIERATFKVKGKTVDKSTWQQAVKKSTKKKRISIALDPDVLLFFQEQAGEKGYQTLINQTLRNSMIHEHFKNDLRQVMREELGKIN